MFSDARIQGILHYLCIARKPEAQISQIHAVQLQDVILDTGIIWHFEHFLFLTPVIFIDDKKYINI